MKGNPNSIYESQRVDYAKITSNGRVIGRDGLPVIERNGIKTSHMEEAHIPLVELKNWKGAFEK